MRSQVQTYSGFRLHERPRRFTWGEVWLEVHQVLEQWLTPGNLCFKVSTAPRVFLLTYHEAQDRWEAELIRPQ